MNCDECKTRRIGKFSALLNEISIVIYNKGTGANSYQRMLKVSYRFEGLITAKVEASPELYLEFYIAMADHNVERVRQILHQPGFDPTLHNDFAFHLACHIGNVEIFEMLHDDPRVNVASKNSAAIVFAVNGNHVEIIKRLLKNDRINPLTNHNNAIRAALSNEDEASWHAIVSILLSDQRIRLSDGFNFNEVSMLLTQPFERYFTSSNRTLVDICFTEYQDKLGNYNAVLDAIEWFGRAPFSPLKNPFFTQRNALSLRRGGGRFRESLENLF